jgi:hypothetical protein
MRCAPNAKREPPEAAAADSRMECEPNGCLRLAPRSGWPGESFLSILRVQALRCHSAFGRICNTDSAGRIGRLVWLKPWWRQIPNVCIRRYLQNCGGTKECLHFRPVHSDLNSREQVTRRALAARVGTARYEPNENQHHPCRSEDSEVSFHKVHPHSGQRSAHRWRPHRGPRTAQTRRGAAIR